MTIQRLLHELTTDAALNKFAREEALHDPVLESDDRFFQEHPKRLFWMRRPFSHEHTERDWLTFVVCLRPYRAHPERTTLMCFVRHVPGSHSWRLMNASDGTCATELTLALGGGDFEKGGREFEQACDYARAETERARIAHGLEP
jgi:hypothetical protein